MIVMPVSANDPHYEKKNGRFIYRYGYQPIPESDNKVTAAVEELRIRLKEPAIRKRVTEYCEQVGIPNEYNPVDYGY